ncbi:hypothetical protein HK101_011676 [Irineochytrium annulatum]|nr:hypothetical protein HK101_011676 [Irineochytrium annulatum]
MRKLADYSFMLRDYKFAYSVYETVKKDFSGERAFKYHGGTQEMMALCTLMTDGSVRASVENLLDTAITNYQEASAPILASRDKGWALIDDHVHFSLAKIYNDMGDLTHAIEYYMKPLRFSNQPASQQTVHLNEFLDVYSNCASKIPIKDLEELPQIAIPIILDSSIRVSLLESSRPMDIAEDDVWESMEKDLLEDGFNQRSVSVKQAPRASNKNEGEKTVCAVGGIPADRIREIFTLYYTDDADIALFWEVPPAAPGGERRYGHHYIIGINLGLQAPLQLQTKFGKNASNLNVPSKSLYAATARERKELINSLLKPRQKDVSPVRLLLLCRNEYVHKFANG